MAGRCPSTPKSPERLRTSIVFAGSCRVPDHADKERQVFIFRNVDARFSKILLGVISAPMGEAFLVVNRLPF